MKNYKWLLLLSIALVMLSAGLYLLHFLIFRDARHIFIYLLGDVAFLPIEVLFVTIIIHQLLSRREKRVKLKKLNMVIGTFFSEVGRELLRFFLAFERSHAALERIVLHDRGWSDRDFRSLQSQLRGFPYEIDPEGGDWPGLKAFLGARREFLLSLLGNPNLLEHDKFTDLLWAVFHLTEELTHRDEFSGLPPADRQHLAHDLRRAFHLLALEWLAYMQHLKRAYPYLFSLAMRTNPFDPQASPLFR